MADARTFFTEQELKRISEAIEHAEKHTSGELRVHIGNRCPDDPVRRAQQLLHRLGMTKTKHRNGVLFYFAVKSKKFAIVGDEGIHAKLGAAFWHGVREKMEAEFRAGNFVQGMIDGISEAGHQLHQHFPAGKNDKNELPDTISIGK